MPQVPSPVPTISVADTPLPRVSVNTPEAAFGGATAAAIANLGKVIESSGTELFNRAIALKQVDNQAEAQDADAKYMIGAGDLHAKYNTLEGKERVEAYKKYTQDLQDLRTSIRGGLSNPASQKLYDSSSLSTMGRSIFNGAGAVATANRDWAHTAANAQHELLVKGTYDSPNDPRAFEAAINNNHETATTRAALTPGGASPERVELMIKTGDSTIAANRIIGMARNEPDKASQLFKEYKERGLLFGKDVETVGNKVQSFTQTVGTDMITQQTLAKYQQEDGTFTKSAKEMRDEAVAVAKKVYPDDPKMESATIQTFDKNYSAHNYIKAQDEREVKQQTADYIVKGVNTTALLPADLVKRMSPQDIKDFPIKANSYQSAINKQTDQLQYRGLLGLYNEDNAKFMDTDIMRTPGISKENMNFFLKLQRTAAANGDPRVERAMKQIRGYNPQILDDLQVTGKSKDPTMANQFTGALHEAIQSYQEINGKAPDEKIVTKEIFPAVTRQVTEKGWLWDSKTPFFQSSVPDEYKTRYLQINPEAKESDIRRDYNRQMFDKFFTGQKAVKDQSRVGPP